MLVLYLHLAARWPVFRFWKNEILKNHSLLALLFTEFLPPPLDSKVQPSAVEGDIP